MEIDPRGPRFGAVITVVVLAAALITQSGWLLAAQAVVFAIGAAAGLRYAPYGLVYRYLIRPRLGPPAHTEAEAPPRFAQGVGAVFALAGVAGFAAGSALAGTVFAALALVAAFLNAAFDFCLGCQVYLFIKRAPAARLASGQGPDQEV
jgi:ammonia channel protein AmtB